MKKKNSVLFVINERSCYFCKVKKSENTKHIILAEGLEMASHLGLENVTIGQLALKTGLSKSGLFSHFRSKENLQIEILRFAAEDFKNYVLIPALESRAGITRIKTLVNNWIAWGERLTGGCIFVTASIEYSGRPGEVRKVVLEQQKEWIESLEKIAQSAIKCGEFGSNVDVSQFAYDLYSMLLGFHYYHRMLQTKDVKEKQQKTFDNLLSDYLVKETYLKTKQ